jgi:hypothetical protein
MKLTASEDDVRRLVLADKSAIEIDPGTGILKFVFQFKALTVLDKEDRQERAAIANQLYEMALRIFKIMDVDVYEHQKNQIKRQLARLIE